MLNIDKISHIDVYNSEEWKAARKGKITASLFGKLISEKSHEGKFKQTALSYLQGLAGEQVSVEMAKKEFHSVNTDYGNATEAEAVAFFEKTTGKIVLRNTVRGDTHRLIINDEMSGCTPDALVCLADPKYIFDETGQFLKVAPLEVKCPPVLHRFIKLYQCETPADLKKVESDYYWQVICQMVFCDSLTGYFGAYHPAFPDARMKVITFNKLDLKDDVKKFNLTLGYAKKEIEKIKTIFA